MTQPSSAASNQSTRFLTGLAFMVTLGLYSTLLVAETTESSRSSKSISFTTSSELDQAAKDEQLKQADIDVKPSLVKEGFREETTTTKLLPAGIVTNYSGEISIYNASTELVSDFDYDGFHHRFSVSIDADTIHETSYVYAKLYLSYEGGPWNHYATSNNYHIHGDSVLDSFVIETELAGGFSTGYYDVRIELYDADFGDWLLSYGPYDDASLSNLPLEDRYYDDEYIDDGYIDDFYIETGVAVRAGSMGWWMLMIPGLLMMTRLLSRKRFSQI